MSLACDLHIQCFALLKPKLRRIYRMVAMTYEQTRDMNSGYSVQSHTPAEIDWWETDGGHIYAMHDNSTVTRFMVDMADLIAVLGS